LHALRAMSASGPAWSFPARVYSDAVPFVPGAVLPPDALRAELEVRGYVERRPPLTAPGTFAFDGPTVEMFTRDFAPVPFGPETWRASHLRLTLGGGRLLKVTPLRASHTAGHVGPTAGAPDATHDTPPPGLEPMLIARFGDRDQVRRTWTPLSRVPPLVRRAIVAAEDRRFYSHPGLDLRSNLRALVADLRAGGVREGASTITQQLARGLFLGSRRTIGRKLAEMGIALGLETLLSKDEILEMYLNSVYWGRADGTGIAGIDEAARFYFDMPVESLDVAQAALLAGIIPAPNSSSPFRSPRAARMRRDAALREMLGAGVIDTATADRVRATPLPDHPGGAEPERFVSYVDAVRGALGALPRDAVERHGLVVFTTLDPVWQQRSERGLADGLEALESRIGRHGEPLEGAFVAMDPGDGAVLALVGGRDPRPGDFNRAIQARRQCGSAIKPIVYAAALDPTRPGPRFTPASTLSDLRRSFPTPEGPWTPQNDDGEYHDSVTLAKALAHSINVATANLVDTLGPATVARVAERFGLAGLRPVASIGLGSNEVTLRDLVSAFAVFPAGGIRHEPTPLRVVVDARGHVLLRPRGGGTRVIPATTAAVMTGLLEDVVIFGIAYPLRADFGIMRPLGGKTGTTNDYRDGWFVGFTPDRVAGVWVGRDTPQSLGAPAKDTALPLWAGIVMPLFAGRPATPFESDQGLELVWIDPWTGGRARPECPSRLRVGFLPGTAPRELCARDHSAEWQMKLTARFADSLAVLGDSTARDTAR
ncbi:MAG: transglycosylase domain-containing protein, partial [Candidatus Eisenbacteria bacterium]